MVHLLERLSSLLAQTELKRHQTPVHKLIEVLLLLTTTWSKWKSQLVRLTFRFNITALELVNRVSLVLLQVTEAATKLMFSPPNFLIFTTRDKREVVLFLRLLTMTPLNWKNKQLSWELLTSLWEITNPTLRPTPILPTCLTQSMEAMLKPTEPYLSQRCNLLNLAWAMLTKLWAPLKLLTEKRSTHVPLTVWSIQTMAMLSTFRQPTWRRLISTLALINLNRRPKLALLSEVMKKPMTMLTQSSRMMLLNKRWPPIISQSKSKLRVVTMLLISKHRTPKSTGI